MNQVKGELPKTMLILKASASSLAASEKFLRNREWQVVSTTDPKEAINQLLMRKFSYVLISVDLPGKKSKLLPDLIAQKFPVVVLAFAENSSTVSFRALQATKTDYKVFAPVSGPSIERCIAKFQLDQRTLDLVFNKINNYDPANYVPVPYPLEKREEDRELFKVIIRGDQRAKNTGVVRFEEKAQQELRYHWLQGKKEAQTRNETLIARATQKSLSETVAFLDGVIKNQIEETTNTQCLVIESDRFSGYLVAALGHDFPIEEDFIRSIQDMLVKFMHENGEDVSEHAPMSLKIKQVDFEAWALENAEFMRTSVHMGDEVAMAFFPRKDVRVRLEDSDLKDMAKIRLLDLEGDQQVDFDLYLYLQANKKLVLYTPKGGVFYNDQLERLKQQGVSHMHVNKAAVDAVSKYHAQNYLNGLIDEFDQKLEKMDIGAAA